MNEDRHKLDIHELRMLHQMPRIYEVPKVLYDPKPRPDPFMQHMLRKICRPVVVAFSTMFKGRFKTKPIDNTIKQLRKLQVCLNDIDPGV